MIYFIKDLLTYLPLVLSYTPFALDLQRLSYLEDYCLNYNSFDLICTKYLQLEITDPRLPLSVDVVDVYKSKVL